MSVLRDRMKQDLEHGGYSPRTVEHYLGAVRRFALHLNRSPERAGQKEVRAYIDHLVKRRKVSAAMLKLEMAGIRFLYGRTLGRPSVVAWMSWPRTRPRFRRCSAAAKSRRCSEP